jgi:hypothetical protein
MSGHVFVVQGDLTRLYADILVYTTDWYLQPGMLRQAFRQRFPAFDEWFTRLPESSGLPHPVGTTFWFEPSDGPKILSVVVTDDGAGPAEQTRTAARRAVQEALTRLPAPANRYPLVALPAINLGYGADPRAQNELAAAQVGAALEVLRDSSVACDVVFVTYTQALHRIFLEARRALAGDSTGDPELPPVLVEALAAGECVLFAGAGLSIPTGLPGWGGLVDELARLLALPRQPNDYLHVAQVFRDQPDGPTRLADLIRARFKGGQPTLAHYLLLALPLRLVITTNYDALLENTLAALKRNPVRVVGDKEVARTGSAESVYVVKFHGDADSPEDVVLCRDDYQAFFARRPALAALLRGLLLNQKFLFVGYSLGDENFQQIFGEVARMLEDAQQPAFASTFDAAAKRPAWLPATAPLELVAIPGPLPERHFLLWLDRLAQRVLTEAPPPFLAPDATTGPALAGLRGRLLEMGKELEAACRSPAAADSPVLAGLLFYLAGHGWRPQRTALSGLWQALAAAADSPSARRRYLAAALRCAESAAQQQLLAAQLDEKR